MTKTLLTAALLTLAPLSAWATCSGHADSATLTCAEGLMFDAAKGACVEITSS